MAAPRARAVLVGLVLALSAALSPAAASRIDLHGPHGLAGSGVAGDHLLELLQETAQAEQACDLAESSDAPPFTLWPQPPPPKGQLFARIPEPPLLEPTVPEPWTALGNAGSLAETRIRAFGLFESHLRLWRGRVSRENATGYTIGWRQTYVGPTQKGLWTDPVTGLAYARVRWLDTRNAAWLSEDPMGPVDSPNLYAFVGWQPSMGIDPMGTCLGLNDTPCMETVKSVGGMVVGTAESAGEMALGLATAPVVAPYREFKRSLSEAERLYGAYQEGGFEAAFAEDRTIRGERFDDAVETLVSVIPGVNTYRQGAQIVRTYEQEGSFAGGRQVGRTTFSLGLDAAVVYGAARAARGAVLGEAVRPTLSQVRALRGLGVDEAARRAFFEGAPVEFKLPTAGGEPTRASAQLVGRRLRVGIVSVKDLSGAGPRAFFNFSTRARSLARTMGAKEVEIYGALIINEDIEGMLLRQGYVRGKVTLPEELGGGTAPVLRRVYPVRR